MRKNKFGIPEANDLIEVLNDTRFKKLPIEIQTYILNDARNSNIERVRRLALEFIEDRKKRKMLSDLKLDFFMTADREAKLYTPRDSPNFLSTIYQVDDENARFLRDSLRVIDKTRYDNDKIYWNKLFKNFIYYGYILPNVDSTNLRNEYIYLYFKSLLAEIFRKIGQNEIADIIANQRFWYSNPKIKKYLKIN